jgi:hypothetical protein
VNTPGSIKSDADRSLPDELLTDSRLYKQSKAYKELLDFVVWLPNLAVRRCDLALGEGIRVSYAASADDWQAGRDALAAS